MTNCDQYRQAIAADPSHDDPHVEACAACREFRDEMRTLDAQIRLALAIPVPQVRVPPLPDIDTADVATLPTRQPVRSTWLAFAASLLVAAGIGFWMLADPPEYPTLADEIVAHLDHEPYALRITDQAVSDSRLARVVPADVATLDHDAGLITYAQSCVINGKTVPHLVIQGENGPVTILLMPNEQIREAQSLAGRSINGVILPVGNGSIAIIGEKNEDLERIETELRSSVTWST